MLLDTAGLYCILDRRDQNHRRAIALFERAPRRFIHDHVFAELVALADVRGLNREDALTFLDGLLAHPTITVEWVTERRYVDAVALLRTRRDKRYSLCDAVSFLIMRERGVTDALTTDHHFEQEGFTRLLKP